MEEEAGPSTTPVGPPATSQANANKAPPKRVKKHATVYQKNALYGAYRFWRKKNEDLKNRGIDVGFEWKELFEFFGFAKTTGFKVIKDADHDPSTLLRRDETGRVETRGRKPKMTEDQIQQVEKLLDGQDPFAEGIEWKVIAKNLDLDVHKHTVRRTIRRTLQARRKQSTTTPSKAPAPAPVPNTPNAPPAPIAPQMQISNLQMTAPPDLTIHQTITTIPSNLDPRIMAMSAAQLPPHGNRPTYSDAEVAQMLSNAS